MQFSWAFKPLLLNNIAEILLKLVLFLLVNCISGILVCVLVSSALDRGFEPWLCQTKDYKIGICFFFTKRAA